ncbi:unnamed protein product [Ectocarpus sp. CCAP 1310/34]|nr:unnamed protein product [Ectocarpus sp. CCAP 1310/34]
MGSFGGTYFRPIKSSVTGKSYRDQWKEFPAGKLLQHPRRVRLLEDEMEQDMCALVISDR